MSTPKRVAFVSLGCAKNLVDSETMLGRLVEAGYHLTAEQDDADVVVVNTCGFLSASRDEADEVIREMVALKQTGRCRRVVVAG
ncbi:MAG: 30S ribosomal protein S12 methylthiotransferase RimO, partial [Planctomycetes bacterium]|nr:30S ribosomal protein S12 methylthiotransferase RimO [Planctomycetota bacterium]